MNEILYEFEQDKKYIEEYPLETTEGTKKMIRTYHINAIDSRNAFIKSKLEKYEKLSQEIYDLLKQRVAFLTPKNNSISYENINNQIKIYEKMIKFSNEYNDTYEKLDFDKIVSNISDIDVSDLSKVNDLLKDTITIFSSANILLNINDFDYSMYTEEYMRVFFTTLNNEKFEDSMKIVFDKIYWECPNIVVHLKLNIRYLYTKYKKQLELYYQMLRNALFKDNDVDFNSYYDNYVNLNKTLEETKAKDCYLLSNSFLNSELSIYDYLDDTPQVRKNFNRFLFDKEFNDLGEKEKIDFYKEIKGLKNIVVELNNYNLYKDFVKDVIERYHKKDSFKGIYDNKLKEVEKAEKERIDLLERYRKDGKKFLFFTKKTDKELLKVKIEEQIKKLDTLYTELDNDKINDVVASNLNDTSTIYDALNVCVSFYNYFKSLYIVQNEDKKDLDYEEEYDKLFCYIHDINNTFIDKIKFIDDSDISEIIYDKYKLLNINVTKEDLTEGMQQLEISIDFVNLLNNIQNSDISVNDIKTIIEFQKINKN